MLPSDAHPLHACRDCGLLQTVPHLENGMVARCERCDAVLRWARTDALPRALACALAASFLFVLATLMPFMHASAAGHGSNATLWTGPETLRAEGYWELGLVVAVTLLAMPAAKLAVMLTALVSVRWGRPPRWLPWLFATFERIGPWAMIEVYVLGMFVAYTRIRALADVTVGPACFALGAAMLALAAADASLDREALWEAMERAGVGATVTRELRPGQEWLLCEGCGLTEPIADGQRCRRCRHELHRRKPESLARAWAFLVAGAILYVPANALPVMSFTKLGRGGATTILGGIQELFAVGLWPLGALVFVASFLVPLLKLLGLGTMLLMTHAGSASRLVTRTRLFRFTSFIGRWSMIDIFALTTLVALVHMGFLAQVLARDGAIAFCGVVVTTMLAAEFFDPRLMWDAAGANTRTVTP